MSKPLRTAIRLRTAYVRNVFPFMIVTLTLLFLEVSAHGALDFLMCRDITNHHVTRELLVYYLKRNELWRSRRIEVVIEHLSTQVSLIYKF